MTVYNGGTELAKGTFVGSAICELMGQHDHNTLIPDVTQINVTIQINGVEVDAGGFFKHLEVTLGKYAAQEAKKLVLQRVQSLQSTLFDLERVVNDKLHEAFPEVRVDEYD